MSRRRARLIALALLLLVGAVHYGVDPLARTFEDFTQARKALFYVAQGVKGVCLFALIAAMAPRRITAAPLYLVCLWGVFEDSLVAGCRLAKGIGGAVIVESWRGVCSLLTNEPVFMVGPVIGAIAAGALLWEFDDASRDKSLTDQAKS